MPHALVLLLIALLWFCGSDSAQAAPEGFKPLEIGEQAPDFSLPGVDGKSYSLKDFAEAKLLVVIFTCNHCPTAQAYESRIIKLHADYHNKSVAFVAISPNDDQAVRLDELGYTDLGDSFEDMKLRAKERGFAFPYLYDGEKQKAAFDYGAVATPQVYVFDQERKLRYVGRIDNSDVKEVTSHDARNAIEAVLNGQPVPVERTRTFGCSIKWWEKRAEAKLALDKSNQEPVDLKPLDETTLKKLVQNHGDQLLVINVWATWCGPCVQELPEFVTMNRMYRHRNFKLVTISIDELEEKEAALKVLQEKHCSATNYISALPNPDKLADLLDPKWAGPVPHTLLIAPGGEVIARISGQITPLEVRRRIVDVIGRTYASKKKSS